MVTDIEKCLRQMIELCHRAQLANQTQKQNIPALSWYREFCTVRLSGPRQSGHTTAIANISDSLDSIVLFSNEGLRNRFPRKNKAFTWHQLNHLRGLDANAIIVDNAFSCSKSKQDRIYQFAIPIASPKETFFFVFVQ